MSKKRFIKLIMALGIERNAANWLAGYVRDNECVTYKAMYIYILKKEGLIDASAAV